MYFKMGGVLLKVSNFNLALSTSSAMLHTMSIVFCSSFFFLLLNLNITKFHIVLPVRKTVLPYFFGYKTELFTSKIIQKSRPSYKMDLDLWACLKLVLQQNCTGLI